MKGAGCACRRGVFLCFTEDDSGFRQVVWRQLDLYFVTGDDANKVLSHLAGDMGEDITAIRQVHPEHCAREHCRNHAFYFYGIFLGHEPYFVCAGWQTQ